MSGTRHIRHIRHRPLGKLDLPVLLAVGVFIALLAIVIASSTSQGEGTPPDPALAPDPDPLTAPGPGEDWVIALDTFVSGRTVLLDGDLVVRPGCTLVLVQSTVRFQGGDGHSLVVEEGGSLIVDGCTLTTGEGATAFAIEVRGQARLMGSDISRVRGGVQAFSDGLVVERCRLHDCEGPAIELNGHSATISGCTIRQVDVGVSSIAPQGVPMGDVGVTTVDGWSFTLSDTTISAKSYGVYLNWNKTLTGDLDLDFLTTLSNVEITGCSVAGIFCHVDLKDNGGSGALDSLFDLRVTGGYSKSNGGDGIHVGYYIKPTTMSGTTKVVLSITLTSTKLNSNSGHGLSLQDTYNCQQGSAPSITHASDVTLTGCDVSSNTLDGLHIDRQRTIYYAYGTGAKTRSGTTTLTDTTVRNNRGNGVWSYDYHYAYNCKGVFKWTHTIKLLRATIEGNGKDGVNHYMYELLYYGDRVGVDYRQTFDFQDSTIGNNGDNGFDLTSAGYMYYHGTMSLRNDIKVLRCRLHNNTNYAGYTNFQMYGYDWQYTFYRRGGWTVENSRIEDNGNGGVTGKCGGWSYYAEFDMIGRIVGNTVRGNGGDRAFGFEGMSGNKGEALATGNAFDHNGGGGGTVALEFLYFSQYVVYGNVFSNDTHRTLIRFVAPLTAGPSPNVGPKYADWVQVYANVFEDCDTGAGWTDGAIVIDGYTGAGSLLVIDNVLTRCAGTALATNKMGGTGWLRARNNVLETVGGSGFSFTGSTTSAKAEVSGNTMRNGTGGPGEAFVHIQDDAGSNIVVTGNVAENSSCAGVVSTGGTGPGALTVKDNRLLGLGGNAIDLLGNRFTVENNQLSDCKGFAIALRGFTSLPSVGINNITGAENGLLLEAKERSDGKRLMVVLDNITWEVNGTAISTNHLDIVITNSTLKGRRALTAADGTIKTISTAVPYISGSTSQDGRIEVYYSLGLNLSWADADGVGSGLPCPDALVVFRRGTGSYFTSRIAGPDGRTRQELIPAWMVVNGQLDQLSPYDLEITASGLTTHATLVLEADHVADVLVVDWAKPAVTIEKPYQGALVNTADLTVKGFLSEMGSGITGAWASMDGETWMEVEPDDIWSVRFEGLVHGSARVFAKASDRSGNVNVTVVDFTVDLRGPDLEVLRPLDGTQTRDSYVIVEARSEKTAELFLDGVGVANRNGAMFERMHLRQGLNIIVVEAVDTSGNAAIQVLHVWLDTDAPALFVSSPVDGDVAAQAVVVVEGRTEATATVTINDEPASVSAEGWFRTTHLLTSRENLLIIASEDPAGNVNTSYVRVTLDDQTPVFQVTTPTDGMLTPRTQVEVEGSLSQADLDASVYINGKRIDHVGRFTSTVVLVEGENCITIDVVDPNGRMSTMVIRVVRDTSPPVIDLDSPPTLVWTTRDMEVPFIGRAATASELTVGGQRARLEPDGSFNHTFKLEAGTNTVELCAKDAAGNVWTVVLTVRWDPSPPDLRVSAPPARTGDETVLLNGTTDGFIVRVDGVPVEVVDGAFSVPVHLGVGVNTFTITSEDEAGNIMSHQVSIERTAGMQVESAYRLPGGLGVSALVPLVLTVVALIATAAMMRRAPPARVARNGRARPRRNGTGNGHGMGNGNGHATTATPGSAEPMSEPLYVDVPEATSTALTPTAATAAPAPYSPYGAPTTYGAPAYETPAYETPAYEPLAYEPPAYEPPAYETSSYETSDYEPQPYEPPVLEDVAPTDYSEAQLPAPAPELKLEFAPLPVFSVPDPLTVGTVDIGTNGEYSATPHVPPVQPVHIAAPAAAMTGTSPRCTHCGSELEPEWILCPECETPTGVELPTAAPEAITIPEPVAELVSEPILEPIAEPTLEPEADVIEPQTSVPTPVPASVTASSDEIIDTTAPDATSTTTTTIPTTTTTTLSDRALSRLWRARTDLELETPVPQTSSGPQPLPLKEEDRPRTQTPLPPSRAERRFFSAKPWSIPGLTSRKATPPPPQPSPPRSSTIEARLSPRTVEPPVQAHTPATPEDEVKATRPAPVPEPVHVPEPVYIPEPVPEPVNVPEPVHVTEPVPEPVRVPEPILIPEPVPEPIHVPEPVYVPEPVQVPEPIHISEPVLEPVHTPEPVHVPVALVADEWVPEPEYVPVQVTEPIHVAEPVHIPEPMPEPIHAPEPVKVEPALPRPVAMPRPTALSAPRPISVKSTFFPRPVPAPKPVATPKPVPVPTPTAPLRPVAAPKLVATPKPVPVPTPVASPMPVAMPRPAAVPVTRPAVSPMPTPAPRTVDVPEAPMPAPEAPRSRPSMHVLPGPVPLKEDPDEVLYVSPVPERSTAPRTDVAIGPREEVTVVRPPAPRPVPTQPSASASRPRPSSATAPVPAPAPTFVHRPSQQSVSKPNVRGRFFGAGTPAPPVPEVEVPPPQPAPPVEHVPTVSMHVRGSFFRVGPPATSAPEVEAAPPQPVPPAEHVPTASVHGKGSFFGAGTPASSASEVEATSPSPRPPAEHVPTASELAKQRKVIEELLDELTFDDENDDN